MTDKERYLLDRWGVCDPVARDVARIARLHLQVLRLMIDASRVISRRRGPVNLVPIFLLARHCEPFTGMYGQQWPEHWIN